MLYENFVMPQRAELGDLDPSNWPAGLSGQPQDPWQHQMAMVLQDPKSHELFTFTTTSLTGRRACGNLLRHFDRMQRRSADEYPIVRLKPGSFMHRDERIGIVRVPAFAVVGTAPKHSVSFPELLYRRRPE